MKHWKHCIEASVWIRSSWGWGALRSHFNKQTNGNFSRVIGAKIANVSKLQNSGNWKKTGNEYKLFRKVFPWRKEKCKVLVGLFVGVFAISLFILRRENIEDFC